MTMIDFISNITLDLQTGKNAYTTNTHPERMLAEKACWAKPESQHSSETQPKSNIPKHTNETHSWTKTHIYPNQGEEPTPTKPLPANRPKTVTFHPNLEHAAIDCNQTTNTTPNTHHNTPTTTQNNTDSTDDDKNLFSSDDDQSESENESATETQSATLTIQHNHLPYTTPPQAQHQSHTKLKQMTQNYN